MIELAGCNPQLLDNIEEVREALLRAATKAKATVLGNSFHKFTPQGVSGVVVIAESHLSVHTWPELGYAAVDIFTCGDRAMPHRAAEYLIEAFCPTHHGIQEVDRGIPEASRAEAGPRSGRRIFDQRGWV
jgi:S-adenosylmethionine decarboxylase